MTTTQTRGDTNRPSRLRRLPGDPDSRTLLHRMIRVDHAGEVGAARIYDGQLAVLGRTAAGEPIRRMAEQEKRHRAAFETLMAAHHVRPTVLSPVWHLAGFALGAATALMGPRTAMACTVAVEEVIGEHYAQQLSVLGEAEPDLARTIEEFRSDEMEHRDVALAHEAARAPGGLLLSAFIKAGTKLAIALSTRL